MLNYSFRKLSTKEDFQQCMELQKSVFGLTDTEVVSPLLLKLFDRNLPPVGIALGMFGNNCTEELVGFIIGMATFSKDEVYIPLIGIKNTQQNKGLGVLLVSKFIETANAINISKLSCLIDPLDPLLARFYFSKLNFKSVKYIENAYSQDGQYNSNNTGNDSLLIQCDLKESKKGINEDYDLNHLPIASVKDISNSKRVLLEIPANREDTGVPNTSLTTIQPVYRELFTEYLNNQNYIITDCITINKEGKRKLYYLLEKQ